MTNNWIFTVPLLLVFGKISGVDGWPEGTYGIPMPKTGCPSVTNFEWSTGSRTQHTEMGSHASEDIHLAGVYADPTDKITQSFCMKTIPVRDGHYNWQPGQYCIYKKGSCPTGFKDGWLYWDDAAPWWGTTIQNTQGTTPDGEYDRNTKIYFCCRSDGPATRAIELPTTSPFHLLKRGEQCQKIKGMKLTEEYVQIKGESTINLSLQGGTHPKVYRRTFPEKFTRLYYCYYKPEPESKTMQTVLVILYIAGGVVGTIIVILILMCIAQRFFSKNPKEYYEEHTMSSMQPETMMTSTGRENSSTGGAAPHAITISSTNPAGVSRSRSREPIYRPNGTVPPHNPKYAPPSTLAGVVPAGAAAGMVPRGGGEKQRHPVNNPGAFAMPAGGDIVESPEPQGDESTPMLGATGTPTTTGPRPPSYKEAPEPGTASGIHTPSEAGSPVHEASSPMEPLVLPNGLPVTMAGLRPISQPPSYEDVLREDHRRHPGAIGAFGSGILHDDDHFECRGSDSD